MFLKNQKEIVNLSVWNILHKRTCLILEMKGREPIFDKLHWFNNLDYFQFQTECQIPVQIQFFFPFDIIIISVSVWLCLSLLY